MALVMIVLEPHDRRTMTGQCAQRTTFSATEPIKKRDIPVRPLEGMTISVIFSASAKSTISAAGSPCWMEKFNASYLLLGK